MTGQVVAPVELHRVTAEHPFHSRDKIWPRCLDYEMKMIAHETIGMDLPASPAAGLTEGLDEPRSVSIVAKDRFASVAPVE